MSPRTSVAIVCLAAASWGCSSTATSHAVAAKDYPQTCVDVVDCAPITEGAIGCCGPESCPNAAIRADAVSRYMNDVSARTPRCTPPPECIAAPCPDGRRIACTNGVCELLSTTNDGAVD